ncbi:MAG: export-related chaperone CsaA [Armatimonadetes bacterium]|jgi:tRNA-binding protein|nr:export-related chaperone CsaA [Armatimonadota bacterium]
MDPISWGDFERVELRAGTVLEVREFPAARKPAYQLRIDFGPLGERWSSAQITTYYDAEQLVGKQVLAVLNFPPKRIAGFKSEVLVTGFVLEDGSVVLAQPERPVPNGSKLT